VSILLFLFLALSPPVAAIGQRSGESAAQFLRIGAGARALAMGEAYSSVAEGPEGVYWNPAGLTSLRKKQVHYSRSELLKFFHHDFLAYGQPLDRGALGFSFTRWSQDSLPLTTNANTVIGKFAPHSEAVSIAYAHRLAAEDPEEADRGYFRDTWMLPGTHRPIRDEIDPWQGALSLGVALKFVRETIHTYSANAFAIDAGLIYRPLRDENWSVGLALRNAGSSLRFIETKEPLPAELALATSYDYRYDERSRLLPAFEVAAPVHGRLQGKAGLEWTLPAGERSSVAFRFGYKTQGAIDLGAIAGLTGGIGIGVRRFTADFAFQPMAQLGEVYRISLGYRF
jgi:hypothetical protein